jgi:DNA polymerase-3 subunit epsilon
MTFVAIDFETATADRDSACSVGAVRAELHGGELHVLDTFDQLIRPPDNDYDAFNIAIHGITPKMTRNAPTFDQVLPELSEFVGTSLVVAHNTAFDMYVVLHSADYWDVQVPAWNFVCTYRMARSTWPELYSYRLDVLADEFDIPLTNHHDALADATAAAMLAQHLCRHHAVASLHDVATRLGYVIGRLDDYQAFSNARGSSSSPKVRLSDLVAQGEVVDHPLLGVHIAFTGTLNSMTRIVAAQRAANVGALPQDNVTAHTRYLVMGVTDLSRVRNGASSKAKKAVALASSGSGIEIIDEVEFLRLLGAG